MADEGFLAAKFDLGVVRQPDQGAARLVVKIADEGPKAVVGQIEISGNKKNSKDEITKFLKIKPGSPITAADCVRMENALWRSGRFRTHRVMLDEGVEPSGRVGVRIEVTEEPTAPRLSELLRPEDQALLKLRDWLARPDRWPGDLVATGAVGREAFTCVLSPARGILASYSQKKGPEPPELVYAAVVSADETAFFSGVQRARMISRKPHAQPITHFAIKPTGHEAPPYNLGWSLGWGTLDTGEVPNFQLNVDLEPVAFVAEGAYIREYGFVSRVWERRWVLTRKDLPAARIEVATEGPPDLRASLMNQEIAHVCFERKGFERHLAELEKSTAAFGDASSTGHPWQSWSGFLLGQTFVLDFLRDKSTRDQYGWRAEDAPAIEAFAKAAARAISERIDPWYNEPDSSDDGVNFWIPGGEWSYSWTNCSGLDPDGHRYLARLGLAYSDNLLPRNTWAWTAEREAALIAVGRSRDNGEEFVKIGSSDRAGPICALVAATLLQSCGSGKAGPIAGRGLARLSLDDFRKDYRVVFRPGYPWTKGAEACIEAVRTLDAKDARTLADLFARKNLRFLAEGMTAARKHPDQSAANAIPAVLDALWRAGLREHVKQELEEVQHRPPGATQVAWLEGLEKAYALYGAFPTVLLPRPLRLSDRRFSPFAPPQ